jgi:hypothetical protein
MPDPTLFFDNQPSSFGIDSRGDLFQKKERKYACPDQKNSKTESGHSVCGGLEIMDGEKNARNPQRYSKYAHELISSRVGTNRPLRFANHGLPFVSSLRAHVFHHTSCGPSIAGS